LKNLFTAFIERDVESGMYIGTVPGLTGAHTYAETMDELQEKLREVIILCLEEEGVDSVNDMPEFAGIYQFEVAL
jgi:predicted RNase H-like HicB family nuclease